jgi:hypothetical protein
MREHRIKVETRTAKDYLAQLLIQSGQAIVGTAFLSWDPVPGEFLK